MASNVASGMDRVDKGVTRKVSLLLRFSPFTEGLTRAESQKTREEKTMDYVREYPVTRKYAEKLLRKHGINEFPDNADWYTAYDREGNKYLTCWGWDEPWLTIKRTPDESV